MSAESNSAPPQTKDAGALTSATADGLSIDPSNAQHFTAQIHMVNDGDRPIDLRRMAIGASVDGQGAMADDPPLLGEMAAKSRLTLERSFTTEQPVTTHSNIRVVIDLGESSIELPLAMP